MQTVFTYDEPRNKALDAPEVTKLALPFKAIRRLGHVHGLITDREAFLDDLRAWWHLARRCQSRSICGSDCLLCWWVVQSNRFGSLRISLRRGRRSHAFKKIRAPKCCESDVDHGDIDANSTIAYHDCKMNKIALSDRVVYDDVTVSTVSEMGRQTADVRYRAQTESYEPLSE